MVHEPLALLARYRREGLLDFLERARDCGLKLGVLSDYPARRKLEALGVAPYFDVVMSAQDREIGRLKPDPKGLLAILAALQIEPAEAVYLGDRPDTDASVALAAGVPCLILGARSTPARNGLAWTEVRSLEEASRHLNLADEVQSKP
jgi:phosphoglycolate phosphatase/putative hydrolase of the HAD superfamily